MNKTWVIMSYWYGASLDDARYGEVSKVERVVNGTYERAVEVDNEINEKIKTEYGFCYTDIVETTVTE